MYAGASYAGSPYAGSGRYAALVDLACAYSIRADVAGDLALAYAIRADVASDLALSYVIRTLASADLDAAYTVHGQRRANLTSMRLAWVDRAHNTRPIAAPMTRPRSASSKRRPQ